MGELKCPPFFVKSPCDSQMPRVHTFSPHMTQACGNATTVPAGLRTQGVHHDTVPPAGSSTSPPVHVYPANAANQHHHYVYNSPRPQRGQGRNQNFAGPPPPPPPPTHVGWTQNPVRRALKFSGFVGVQLHGSIFVENVLTIVENH